MLGNIVKRRQLKLRGIEANINEIKSLLQPYSNQNDYKIKERELQDIIKKYDLEIQAKKQKKFKRDVLDYTNRRVYKWQIENEVIDADHDEISLDDNPSEDNAEMGVPNQNTLRQTRFEHLPTVRNVEAPRTPNYARGRAGNRRENHYEPHYGRSPVTPPYNVPMYNRFSPIREERHYTSQWSSGYRRDNGRERDFFQGRPRDRPPGRWNAKVQYRRPGWRGTQLDCHNPRRGEDFPMGTNRVQRRNGYPSYPFPSYPGRNIENGESRNSEREPEYTYRDNERNRQEENEGGGRKRRREY